MEILSLVIACAALTVSILFYCLNRKTFELFYKQPFIEIEDWTKGNKKYDIAKNPSDEKFIRIFVYNPSSFGNYIKLECSEVCDYSNKEMFKPTTLRRETDDGEIKKNEKLPFDRFVRLPPSERIFFDLFLIKANIPSDKYSGKKFIFTLTDIKSNRITKSITL